MFYGDVTRPEVLNAFNVGKAKAVICTLAEVKGTNTAVVNLRREFPDLPVRKGEKTDRTAVEKRAACVCMYVLVRVGLFTLLFLLWLCAEGALEQAGT